MPSFKVSDLTAQFRPAEVRKIAKRLSDAIDQSISKEMLKVFTGRREPKPPKHFNFRCMEIPAAQIPRPIVEAFPMSDGGRRMNTGTCGGPKMVYPGDLGISVGGIPMIPVTVCDDPIIDDFDEPMMDLPGDDEMFEGSAATTRSRSIEETLLHGTLESEDVDSYWQNTETGELHREVSHRSGEITDVRVNGKPCPYVTRFDAKIDRPVSRELGLDGRVFSYDGRVTEGGTLHLLIPDELFVRGNQSDRFGSRDLERIRDTGEIEVEIIRYDIGQRTLIKGRAVEFETSVDAASMSVNASIEIVGEVSFDADI